MRMCNPRVRINNIARENPERYKKEHLVLDDFRINILIFLVKKRVISSRCVSKKPIKVFCRYDFLIYAIFMQIRKTTYEEEIVILTSRGLRLTIKKRGGVHLPKGIVVGG